MKSFFLFILFFCTSIQFSHASYIKGVTYFGDAWPINFWNSNLRNSGQDFEKIKEDGFNSVFIVVPWGEFQPDLSKSYFNEKSYERLSKICDQAKSKNLKLFMRVSYMWDMHPSVKMPTYERFGALFNNDDIKNSWSKYLEKISKITNDCATGVFLSWEDYWHIIDRIKNAENIEQRLELSEFFGFDKWVKSEIKKGAKADDFKNFFKNGFYHFPSKNTVEFRNVYSWFDDQLINRLLPVVAQHFKSASIEARVDDDPIYDGSKIVEWYSHKKTFNIKSSEYIFTYWAPAMGAQNVGEKESADKVLKRFAWMQNKIAESTQNKIVIAQLLFEDNTPSAVKNAVIIEKDKSQFFNKVAASIISQTNGYALWGAKDYDANMIFNPSFDLGLEGWSKKSVKPRKNPTKKTDNYLILRSGEQISQQIPTAFNHFKGAWDHTKMRIRGEGNAVLEVSYFGKTLTHKTNNKKTVLEMEFPVADSDSLLEIKVVDGEFKFQDINLFPFTTIANFRNVFNKPEARFNDILELNAALEKVEGIQSTIFPDEKSLSIVRGVYGVESNGSNSYAWASPAMKMKMHVKSPKIEMKGFLSDGLKNNNCNLDIYLDNKKVASKNFKKSGEFVVSSEISKEFINKVVDVNILSSCSVDTTVDKRELSYIFKGISFNVD